ncbi:hypothetical protein [Clostridium botulinum]|uniref:hypothetical protein n=1 Tax=Clostridium botulinum TaxID=1491 RepID=UPI001E3B6AE0|nr:hypothetical protein [Clostridium botulinum]MCD3254371.1 hypothetical protein [Clostridium botulinum C/D]MCD3279871.1 hypothetical protein [Clostridium botulinum C/D]MCD3339602.1 hypothetical protein [Clostridium botulinum C/D]MCD3357510.1 hypothetical protein [Clostridium botulinum C/D]
MGMKIFITKNKNKLKEETVQDSKKYKEMQQEIERIHTYECAKAYFKLHEANDYIKEQVPITLQEGEILVFVDGYAFAVSFDDVEHYFAIGDDDILEYREDDEGKEYFKESECQQYAFENLMWNAIEFMENED